MRIKIIIALLMALCLLAFAFVSCGNGKFGDGEETSTAGADNDNGSADSGLEKYELIYADGVSYEVENAFSSFSAELYKLTGVRKVIHSDSESSANDNEYEILVGDTNRAQSTEAKTALDGLSFSITKNGNKIVIVATNMLILEDAVNYFAANLKKLDDGTVEYPTNYTYNEYQALELVTDGKANYSIVFTDFYNNINKHTDSARDEFGFTRIKVKELAGDLKAMTGVSFDYYAENMMSSSKKEIIIGKLNGDTNDYFEYHESGVYLKDGDIYIYGHNHEGIEYALKSFLTRVSRYNKIEKDKYSILCQKEGYKFSNSDIKYDIPLPDNMNYEGAYTAANNGIYLVYENTSLDAFESYSEKLKAAGFTQYFNRKASTNYFAGFYKGDDAAWVYYIDDRKELRIVFEEYQPLPNIETEGTKVQDAYLTQMGVSYRDEGKISDKTYDGNGMGYIIGLEDGRYIIIDGNQSTNGTQGKERLAKEYYDYLKNNNKHPSGKIVIAAWIITHAHVDHYSNFEQFGKTYGSQVECQTIIHNLPTELTLWGAGNVDDYYLENHQKIDAYFKGATVYTVHTGYAATIGGVFLEFMSTYEDLYNNNDLVSYKCDPSVPNSVDEMNDTNVTFRFTFNKGKNDEVKVFFLGDNYFAHGERLASMWDASYLRSTVVQVAHHGWNNGVCNGQVNSKAGLSDPFKSTLYSEIKASYGLYSNYYTHMTTSSVTNLLKSYRANFQAYCNTAADGHAANYTFTFNGTIKVTETKKGI